MYDSVTTWRLYSAEHSIALGTPLPDIDAARALVRRVKRSAWWKRTVDYQVNVRTEVRGSENAATGVITSYASSSELGPLTRWKISMHPAMLNDVIVLHELAHCVAPRMTHSGRKRLPQMIHQHGTHPHHGSGFAGIMAELVQEFGTGAVHDELRAAYKHFDVPVMTLPEYQTAVRQSLMAEADEIAQVAELQELWDSEVRVPPPGGWRVPEFIWGDIFLRYRTRNGRNGRATLAEKVSAIERCSQHMIARVEDSRGVPEDARLRRIAMIYAVVLGIDPIYLRHRVGLVRWECNVELDELRQVNPDWVNLVETMNRQLQERPARWVVDGTR